MITVKYPGKIPGQIEDIDGGSRHGVWYFEDTAVEPDGGIIVDATFSLHTEQVLDIGDLGQFSACVLSGQSFLKWAYAKTAVDALVVFGEVLVKIAVEIVNALSDLLCQELIPDGSKKAFDFSASLGTVWGGMHQVNTQSGTEDFQVRTGVTRAVVGVKALADPIATGCDHHLGNQYFNRLLEVKPGADHIACGIVDDDMQDGFFELAFMP